MLEEIGYKYKLTIIDIYKDEQFKPDFKKISPFSKIPVIIDHDNNENIYAIYPSIGENLDFINLNRLKNIQFLYRELDQFFWQYCNKGFFNFKNYIPKIIQKFI